MISPPGVTVGTNNAGSGGDVHNSACEAQRMADTKTAAHVADYIKKAGDVPAWNRS